MAKNEYMYNGIGFDSQLEVDYYKDRRNDDNVEMIYTHGDYGQITINIANRKNYMPDFIIKYKDRLDIVETKGWDFHQGNVDKMIAEFMKNQVEYNLAFITNWLDINGIEYGDRKITYSKIKKLGNEFVDFKYKKPNPWKVKYDDILTETKELRQFKKDTLKYFELKRKEGKLTKLQSEFIEKYEGGVL